MVHVLRLPWPRVGFPSLHFVQKVKPIKATSSSGSDGPTTQNFLLLCAKLGRDAATTADETPTNTQPLVRTTLDRHRTFFARRESKRPKSCLLASASADSLPAYEHKHWGHTLEPRPWARLALSTTLSRDPTQHQARSTMPRKKRRRSMTRWLSGPPIPRSNAENFSALQVRS